MAPKAVVTTVGGVVVRAAIYGDSTLLKVRGEDGEEYPAIPLGTRKGGIMIATSPKAFKEETLTNGNAGKRGMVGASHVATTVLMDPADPLTPLDPAKYEMELLIVDLGTGNTAVLSRTGEHTWTPGRSTPPPWTKSSSKWRTGEPPWGQAPRDTSATT